jgi:hypothetical protein
MHRQMWLVVGCVMNKQKMNYCQQNKIIGSFVLEVVTRNWRQNLMMGGKVLGEKNTFIWIIIKVFKVFVPTHC